MVHEDDLFYFYFFIFYLYSIWYTFYYLVFEAPSAQDEPKGVMPLEQGTLDAINRHCKTLAKASRLWNTEM